MHYFQNGVGKPLHLLWIDRAGERTDLGEIAPGTFKPMQTYPGHLFLLTDDRRKCRAVVRIGEGPSGTYVGTSRYVPVPMRGWPVFIDRGLDPAAEPARGALAALAKMLDQTERALPAAALAQVRTTPIFLLEHSGPGGMYHFSPDWLVAHGRTVELANAIEISDASVFVDTAKVAPWAVLHELAHSYYAKLADADRYEIDRVYRAAIAKNLYRDVKRPDGSVGPAYASGSAVEYFSELSEAYFGRNDFFPFTRAELATYDPDGLELMARLWR